MTARIIPFPRRRPAVVHVNRGDRLRIRKTGDLCTFLGAVVQSDGLWWWVLSKGTRARFAPANLEMV